MASPWLDINLSLSQVRIECLCLPYTTRPNAPPWLCRRSHPPCCGIVCIFDYGVAKLEHIWTPGPQGWETVPETTEEGSEAMSLCPIRAAPPVLCENRERNGRLIRGFLKCVSYRDKTGLLQVPVNVMLPCWLQHCYSSLLTFQEIKWALLPFIHTPSAEPWRGHTHTHTCAQKHRKSQSS